MRKGHTPSLRALGVQRFQRCRERIRGYAKSVDPPDGIDGGVSQLEPGFRGARRCLRGPPP